MSTSTRTAGDTDSTTGTGSVPVRVCRAGLGLIWLGRQWPPNNTSWGRPTDEQIDAQIRCGLGLLSPQDEKQQLMLDTASGYGESEQRVGAWLRGAGAELASRCVVATKFGDTFDCGTGETVVCHSATAAMSQLAASTKVLGRVDIFYSHITSQLTEAQAEAVLADDELRVALSAAKAEGRVGSIGTSCSFPAVVRAALEQGWLDDTDVVQLPARVCVSEPELITQLRAAGKMIVANSPVRRILSAPDEAVEEPSVEMAVAELMTACPDIACVLVGTGKPQRLQHVAHCILGGAPPG